MKISAACLILLVAVLGCSKKTDPNPANSTCLLTKMTKTQTSSGYTNTYTYEYSQDNQLIKITSTDSNNGVTISTGVALFSYTNGAITSVVDKITPAGGSASTTTYTRTNDGNGRISTITWNIGTASFTYDNAGNLKNEVYSYTGTSASTTTITPVFTTDLASADVVTSAGVKVSFTYASYDGKKNPYALLAKAMNQPFFLSTVSAEPFYQQKANPLTGKVVIMIPGSSTQTENSTYTYDYNTAGYPVKITQNNDAGASPVTTVLEYSGCN